MYLKLEGQPERGNEDIQFEVVPCLRIDEICVLSCIYFDVGLLCSSWLAI